VVPKEFLLDWQSHLAEINAPVNRIKTILSTNKHRPWALPASQWKFYQEWNNSLFLHWKVDKDIVLELIPKELQLDLIDGEAWVSLVAFTMQKIRPRFLPHFRPISDFHEINVRTYVTQNGKPGVYFLSMEGHKSFSVFLSRALSGLPYIKSKMIRNLDLKSYTSYNPEKNFRLNVNYKIKEEIAAKNPLELFLTERYSLYQDTKNHLFRYEIHHLPWVLNTVEVFDLITDYKIGGLDLNKKPDLANYSKGVEVIAWGKEIL
jgi:uncharacterized protein YqjF (DUF2071 family)